MFSSATLYVGSAIVIAWGIAHIAIPTKGIVDGFGPTVVYRASAAVLIIMAVISMATGARTTIVPMKLCPPVFMTAALLFGIPTFV